jgi:hypothetical protein
MEQALLYFMEARRVLPDEAMIPTRLVLEDREFERVVKVVKNPPAPDRCASRADAWPTPLRSVR